MQTKQVINGNGFRYLSEIPEFEKGLPHGILNKKSTDVGGTFAALKCNSNYIIVCPFIDLVESIGDDKNSPNKVFKVYGGVKEIDLINYINTNSIYKIAITYDSFPKLIKWLDKLNKTDSFKILIDEYHLLLEDLGFRETAIVGLINQLKNFKHYTFLSATPIEETFLPDILNQLPYTEIDWGKETKLIPTRIRTNNVTKAVVNLVNEFVSDALYLKNEDYIKVEELYIFCNSVTSISEIIQTCELTNDDVKVVCRDSIRNSQNLKDIEISKVSAPNKPINFFTKKGFQGCNLFTNNGLVVVLSDSSKKQTAIDIQTTIYQINGRLRSNNEYDNVFKNRLWHIYSTGFVTQSEVEFLEELDTTITDSKNIISIYNKLTKEEQETLRKRDVSDLFCIFNGETFEYSHFKEQYTRFNYNLTQSIYKNGLSLRQAYNKAGLVANDINTYSKFDETIIKKIVTVSFRDLLEQYITLRVENENHLMIERFNVEYPLFKDAFDLIGKSGISTCGFVEAKIVEAVKTKKSINLVFSEFYNVVKTDTFISNKDAKEILKTIYKKLDIKGTPTASILKGSKIFEVVEAKPKINGKTVNGIIIKALFEF